MQFPSARPERGRDKSRAAALRSRCLAPRPVMIPASVARTGRFPSTQRPRQLGRRRNWGESLFRRGSEHHCGIRHAGTIERTAAF